MLGPTYDDNYIARKMTSLQSAPTFVPPSSSYGYMQDPLLEQEDTFDSMQTGSYGDLLERESLAELPARHSYVPSSRTQLILNRVALTRPSIRQPEGYTPRMAPRMGPPPPPMYYDYDYGYPPYGGGYGGYGGYNRPTYGGYGYGGYDGGYMPPRYRNYDPYLEDDVDLSYVPRYHRSSRLADTLSEIEKDKLRRSLSPPPIRPTATTTSTLPTDYLARHYNPGLGGEGKGGGLSPRKTRLQSRPKSTERPPNNTYLAGSEGESPRKPHRYTTLSESQMLQDQVDKMRIRLKSMAYCLDPSGPVPDIIIPERSRRVDSTDYSKKYTSALEMTELPRLSARRHHVYPEDDHMKDNLRIKCLSHYKTTQTAAEYWKPKNYHGDETSSCTYTLPKYTSKYSSKTGTGSGASGTSSAKWEEPDTVYGQSTEKKPFSKSTEVDDDDSRKEKRKKKKSKELDELLAIDSASVETSVEASSSAEVTAPYAAASDSYASAAETYAAAEGDSELDDKERKRLEKKKRKAEREAAAKAAMEAELAALAEAEAELARLEAESCHLKPDLKEELKTSSNAALSETAHDPEDNASETTDKCESAPEAPCKMLPECPPTEFECEPSLYPSSVEHAVDESLQGTVEEPIEEVYSQDPSAEMVVIEEELQHEAEVGPQVTEQIYEPEIIAAEVNEPELPPQEEMETKAYDAPVDKHISEETVDDVKYDEPIEAADPYIEPSASTGDDNQQIGMKDTTGVTQHDVTEEDVPDEPVFESEFVFPEED